MGKRPRRQIPPLFDLTNTWTYGTANLDGVNWTAPAYDDSGRAGAGSRPLWADMRGPNPDIPIPLNTEMPGDPNNSNYPYITYYLRTHFTFTNSLAGVSLLVTDYVDDGAVFYLNGVEVYRLRMDPYPAPIDNGTLAAGYGCDGNATCPDFFTISGDVMTNLVTGDNVLAVEVHNYDPGSPDITFGMSLDYTEPYAISPTLSIVVSDGTTTLSWSRLGFTLQQATSVAGPWTDVPGPVISSPFAVTNAGPTAYFRLRK